MAGGVVGPFFENMRKGGPKGIRFPMEVKSATFDTFKQVDKNYGGAAADWTLSPSEQGASVITASNSNGAVNAVFPVAQPGKILVAYNATSYNLVVKVSGQTGITIATTKTAILRCSATDFVRVTADT